MINAILGPKGRINRLTETVPASLPEGASVVQLTDEQQSQVEAGRSATPPVAYFVIEGQLTQQVSSAEERKAAQEERKAEQLAAQEQRRSERIAARVIPSVSAERHIERQGYPAMRLVTLMDLEGKLAAAGLTATKLVAVRAWLDTVLATFAANPEPRNDWASAPYGFEETVSEAVGTMVGAVP
jgi:hypothetical protein